MDMRNDEQEHSKRCGRCVSECRCEGRVEGIGAGEVEEEICVDLETGKETVVTIAERKFVEMNCVGREENRRSKTFDINETGRAQPVRDGKVEHG